MPLPHVLEQSSSLSESQPLGQQPSPFLQVLTALKLQLEYGIRSLWDAPAAAVIALRARCGATDCEAARESLKQVVEAHYP